MKRLYSKLVSLGGFLIRIQNNNPKTNNFINSQQQVTKRALAMESEQVEVEEATFNEQVVETSEQTFVEEEIKETEEKQKGSEMHSEEDRSSFVHGLSVGLGIGCIATFVIMWITVFFSPMLPSTITYESMLSVFIYPLIYLLAVGLIALTAGVVREYYSRK